MSTPDGTGDWPQPITRWPDADAPGTYRADCSCGKWETTGTAPEITAAGAHHDDSPWRHHIVIVRERLS